MAEPPPASRPEPPRRRRRPPPRPPQPPARPPRGDVYVNMQTDFRAQLSRCQKLLAPAGGLSELRLHGLGLAVPRAVHLALQLEAAGGGALRLAASTSTVRLADDDGTEDEDQPGDHPGDPRRPPPAARARHNSAVHIRVLRAAPGPE